MDVSSINYTIRGLCEEVAMLPVPGPLWPNISEEKLLAELALCIFSSQILFEVALGTVKHLKEVGLLNPLTCGSVIDYTESVRAALIMPLEVATGNNVPRTTRVRFPNRLATLLASTVQRIYGSGISIGWILRSAESPYDARALLIKNVSGFGPKQASLYLRRTGYCSDLAVLDTHVIDYLRITNGIEISPSHLSKLSFYEKIEIEFAKIADQFGYTVGCVDLATWVTMRVAKREYAI